MSRSILLAGLPTPERRTPLAGTATTLLEGGDGPPLMLMHGGIEAGGAYWAPLIPALAQQHRVVVPDLPGLGESDAAAEGLTQAVFDRWFLELLAATCDEPPVLIAHSLGGSLAARFASRHGDRLRSLVIYGAPAIAPYRMPLGLMLAAMMFNLKPSLANQHRFERWAFLDPARTRSQHPDWFDAFDAYCIDRGRRPLVRRTMRQLVQQGTRPIPDAVLARIAVPTSLIWGRHDRMVPLRVASAAAATHGWPLQVIEAAGHVPHLEQPDAFLGVLYNVLPSRRAALSRSTP
jgi:2-hydroxymuconate-semialdehyde hydrolase